MIFLVCKKCGGRHSADDPIRKCDCGGFPDLAFSLHCDRRAISARSPAPWRRRHASPGMVLPLAGVSGQFAALDQLRLLVSENILHLLLTILPLVTLALVVVWAGVRFTRGFMRRRAFARQSLVTSEVLVATVRAGALQRQEELEEAALVQSMEEAYTEASKVYGLFRDGLAGLVAKLEARELPAHVAELLQNGQILLEQMITLTPDLRALPVERERLTGALRMFARLGDVFRLVDAALTLESGSLSESLPGKPDVVLLHRRIDRAAEQIAYLSRRYPQVNPLAKRFNAALPVKRHHFLPDWTEQVTHTGHRALICEHRINVDDRLQADLRVSFLISDEGVLMNGIDDLRDGDIRYKFVGWTIRRAVDDVMAALKKENPELDRAVVIESRWDDCDLDSNGFHRLPADLGERARFGASFNAFLADPVIASSAGHWYLPWDSLRMREGEPLAAHHEAVGRQGAKVVSL